MRGKGVGVRDVPDEYTGWSGTPRTRYTVGAMPAPRSRQSFEDLYQQLEEKVARLEQGGLSLDDSLATYEDAVLLAQRCQKLLDEAELRITRLRESLVVSDGGAQYEAGDEPEDTEDIDEIAP